MAKVTLYNASENAQIILVDGKTVRVEVSKFVEIEKDEAKKYGFLVSSKEHDEILAARKAARKGTGSSISVGSEEKVKTLEAQMAEMAEQMKKMEAALAKK